MIVSAEPVVTEGLGLPVFATAPPGDVDHLYLSEQNRVRITRLDLATGEISTVLDLPNAAGGQTGLQTFAFHPDYETNGRVFLNMFDPDDRHVKVLEFTRSEDDPTVLDPDSGRQVFSLLNDTGSHNGGWLGFSPVDDYLYILTGDGGNVGGPIRGLPAQDLGSLQGKLLRIDVDGDDFPEDDLRNYSIPEDNPFVGQDGEDEIFAYGLRHPFRAGFDRLTGDLYIGDVGANLLEEINFLPAGSGGGQNFGWRAKEGSLEGPFGDPIPPDVVDPIHEYPRGAGAAVIGGYVYRGSQYPALQGTYFFADFVQDSFFSFRFDGQEVTDLTDRTAELHASSPNGYGGIVSYAESADGELYFVDWQRGDIYRMAAGLVGDYNGNGAVEQSDLDLVLLNWGNDATEPPPNWVNDLPSGAVDQEELDRVLLQWGASLERTPVSVPEPSAWTVCVIALAGGALWGCRLRRSA